MIVGLCAVSQQFMWQRDLKQAVPEGGWWKTGLAWHFSNLRCNWGLPWWNSD